MRGAPGMFQGELRAWQELKGEDVLNLMQRIEIDILIVAMLPVLVASSNFCRRPV